MAKIWAFLSVLGAVFVSSGGAAQLPQAAISRGLSPLHECQLCPHDYYCDLSAVQSVGKAACRRCQACDPQTIEVQKCSRVHDRVCRCARPLGHRCGRHVTTAYWLGYLTNAESLASSRSQVAQATFSTTFNNAPGLISGGKPRITFDQSGVVFYSYHQDTYHNFDYLTLHSRINGRAANQELQRHSQGKWDGISVSGVSSVSAKSNLTFDFDTGRTGSLQRIDNGQWGVASALWISEAAGIVTLKLTTSNAGELRSLGGRVKFQVVTNSQSGNSPFELHSHTGRVGFVRDGVIRFTFHQDVRHSCFNVRLHASLETLSNPAGTRTRRLLVTEEQDNSHGYWDGISVSGSSPVRHGDAFTLDLDFMDGCMTAVDNGPWGVLSVAWLPSDVAWSSGPIAVDATPVEGTIQGTINFVRLPEDKAAAHVADPIQIGDDLVYFRYPGTVVYDLHIAVDNACKDYIYLEAHLNSVVILRELGSGPTFHAVDGLSLSGSASTAAGQHLRFFVTCNTGYIRKVRTGSLSLMWIPQA